MQKNDVFLNIELKFHNDNLMRIIKQLSEGKSFGMQIRQLKSSHDFVQGRVAGRKKKTKEEKKKCNDRRMKVF